MRVTYYEMNAAGAGERGDPPQPEHEVRPAMQASAEAGDDDQPSGDTPEEPGYGHGV
jgi:hypothetical protein